MRDRWRANFYPVGIAHSVVTGSAWAPAPWIAVQRAALGGFQPWEALLVSSPLCEKRSPRACRADDLSPELAQILTNSIGFGSARLPMVPIASST